MIDIEPEVLDDQDRIALGFHRFNADGMEDLLNESLLRAYLAFPPRTVRPLPDRWTATPTGDGSYRCTLTFEYLPAERDEP